MQKEVMRGVRRGGAKLRHSSLMSCSWRTEDDGKRDDAGADEKY